MCGHSGSSSLATSNFNPNNRLHKILSFHFKLRGSSPLTLESSHSLANKGNLVTPTHKIWAMQLAYDNLFWGLGL